MINKVPHGPAIMSHIPIGEILGVIIISFVSFYIYFKTKEIYELTYHRGINYFRKSFLFFGITSVISLFFALINILNFEIIFPYITNYFLIMAFTSLVAILYLFFSLFSKELKYESLVYVIAISVIALSFLHHNKIVFLVTQSLLFIAVGVVGFIKYKHKKRKKRFSNIYIISMLLFVFWLLNSISFQLAIYLDIRRGGIAILNSIIFIYIFYIFRQRFLQK